MFCQAMVEHAYTPDFPWLLLSGKYILNNFALPSRDLFSWSFTNSHWVLNQWLFGTIMAFLDHLLGEQALFRTFILITLMVYVVIPDGLARIRNVPLVFATPITAAALYAASLHLGLKPMIVTVIFLLFQYLLVARYRAGKASAWTTGIQIAFLYELWGNMDPGLALGLLSLILMFVGDFAEVRGWYRFIPPEDAAVKGKPVAFRIYLTWLATAVLASCINPYGYSVYLYLFNLFGQQYLNNAITDLQSPNFHQLTYYYFAVFIGLVAVLLARAKRCLSASDALHLISFSILSLFVQRFFILNCLFYALILPTACFHFYQDFQVRRPVLREWVKRVNRYRPMVYICGAVLASIFWIFPKALAPFKLYQPIQRSSCETMLPGLIAYNDRLRLFSDKVFTLPETGSCSLIVNPDAKVFSDTRFDFYGPRFTENNRNVSALLDADWQPYFKRWGINTVILTKDSALQVLLKLHPEYHTIYEDNNLIIFRRTALD